MGIGWIQRKREEGKGRGRKSFEGKVEGKKILGCLVRGKREEKRGEENMVGPTPIFSSQKLREKGEENFFYKCFKVNLLN